MFRGNFENLRSRVFRYTHPGIPLPRKKSRVEIETSPRPAYYAFANLILYHILCIQTMNMVYCAVPNHLCTIRLELQGLKLSKATLLL